nr:putative holin-like toxin [Clostridium sp. FS41]
MSTYETLLLMIAFGSLPSPNPVTYWQIPCPAVSCHFPCGQSLSFVSGCLVTKLPVHVILNTEYGRTTRICRH